MVRADVLKLIDESQARGAFETVTTTSREVFCTVKSVTMSEAYKAKSLGLEPSVVFVLADYAEYADEKLCEWQNKSYRIVRTYVAGEKIELVCERVTI